MAFLIKYFSSSLKENIDITFFLRLKEEKITEEPLYDYFM
jgi:hypothetical protein